MCIRDRFGAAERLDNIDGGVRMATGDRIRRADLPPELTAIDPFPSLRALQA